MIPQRCTGRRRADARRLGALAALCGALWLAACGSPAGPPQNPAQRNASTLAQAGARAWARGDATQAAALYERALSAAESVEDFELAGAMLLNLALVQGAGGDLAGAQARVDRIVAAPQRYGAPLVARASARKALLYLDAPDLELLGAELFEQRQLLREGKRTEHRARVAVGGVVARADGVGLQFGSLVALLRVRVILAFHGTFIGGSHGAQGVQRLGRTRHPAPGAPGQAVQRWRCLYGDAPARRRTRAPRR